MQIPLRLSYPNFALVGGVDQKSRQGRHGVNKLTWGLSKAYREFYCYNYGRVSKKVKHGRRLFSVEFCYFARVATYLKFVWAEGCS